MRFRHLPVAMIALAFAPPAAAAGRPIVVELFTSEGCSSCPPADALLTELAASRPDVLPLAFHVTYWNSLGWRDPFSLEAATDRQATYAARFGGGSFTPQMVVDGRKSVIGSDASDVSASIAHARDAAAAVPVTLSRSESGLRIAIGAAGGTGRILLVGFDRQHVTRVGRGENGGRTLTESNIVRSIRVLGAWTGAPMETTAAFGVGEEAAILVQAADGRILGAARLDKG